MGRILTTEMLIQQLPGTPADPLQKTKPVELPPGELPGLVYLKKELSKYRSGFELSYLVRRYQFLAAAAQQPKRRTRKAAAVDAVA